MTDTNAAQVANGKAAPDGKDADWKELTVADGDGDGDGEKGGEESQNAPRARRMGWQPKEKYRGKEGDWLDADAFIEKVEGEVPVLRERNRMLDGRVAAQDKKLGDLEAKLKEQNDMTRELLDINRAAMDRGYSMRMKELEDAMDRAAADGDKDAYKAIKGELIAFGKAHPNWTARKPEEKKPEEAPKIAPDVQQWVSENSTWFNPNDEDDEASQYAIVRDRQLAKKYPNNATRLAKVKEDVASRFPEKFENPARKQAQTVASPSAHVNGKGGGKKGRSFSDLDDGAKAAYERIAARTPGFTKDDYVKSYQWDK